MRVHYYIPIVLHNNRAQHKATVLRFPLMLSALSSTSNNYTMVEFEAEHTSLDRLDELAYQHVCQVVGAGDDRPVCGPDNVRLHRRLLPEL